MNLVKDPWLPFKLRDGSVQTLPISAIIRADIVDFALPRADFQGAAYQFAIGLLQTVLAPEDEITWHEYFEQAPTEDVLNQAFNQVQHAFNLSGDGPLFMQDYDPIEHGSLKSISNLLIETPGENGINENKDHFIKRDQCDVMSQEMVALALFTLQLNGPPNKACKGGRVGLRGAGPLTTLITPSTEKSTLWIKLWLNVMNLDFLKWKTPNFNDGSVFPWLAPTISSVPNGKVSNEIYEDDVHPLHVYWAMPNRIRLKLVEGNFLCAITGVQTQFATKDYLILGHGNNYSGHWNHPLTPYQYDKKEDTYRSIKGSSDSITYRVWESITFTSEINKLRCAKVVSHFYSVLPLFIKNIRHVPNLWMFSYDFDKARVDGWYSTTMPIFAMPVEKQEQALRVVKQIQELAEKALYQSKASIESAWFDDNTTSQKKTKRDLSFISTAFWQRSEAAFFTAVAALIPHAECPPNVAKTWLQILRNICVDLFDEYALSELGNARSMAKRIQARQALVGWLFGGKEIKAFMANHQIDIKKEIA